MRKYERPKDHWQVEWTTHCPVDECGDLILDRAESVVVLCNSLEQAKKFAKLALPKDVFGSVRINEVTYSTHSDDTGSWCEPVLGETLHYEGEGD